MTVPKPFKLSERLVADTHACLQQEFVHAHAFAALVGWADSLSPHVHVERLLPAAAIQAHVCSRC